MVKDGYAYLEGTLTSAADSQAGYATVDRLRSSVHAIPGAEAKVGGGSAVNLDIQRATRHDRNLVVPLVLLVVLVILALVLRAIVSPLLLVATVVLSFAAALGVSALVFDHLFGFAGSDPAFPLWTFVFLVALGTDYNIFLMTQGPRGGQAPRHPAGALIGLAATGGVITSAGIVLAGTFAALGTLPLVFITEIGFAVAFGVLLDTFVVRSVLVTALNLDVGRWIWWPSSLHRKRDVALGEPEAEAAKSAVDYRRPQGRTPFDQGRGEFYLYAARTAQRRPRGIAVPRVAHAAGAVSLPARPGSSSSAGPEQPGPRARRDHLPR